MKLEFMVHDWTTPIDGERTCQSDTYGMLCYVSGNGSSANLRLLPYNDGASALFDIPYALFVNKQMYVKAQRNPAGGTWTVEAWDDGGIRQYSSSKPMASTGANVAGHFIRGAATSGSVGFFRVHNVLDPLNGKPPTTENNANRVAEWKFNNSLVAAFGGYDLSGAATYTATPGQVAVAVPQVNPNAFSSQTSLRAGFPNTLTGSSSYSNAEASSTVTCVWSLVEGASKVNFKPNPETCNPEVTGLIFGSYKWQLTVRDASNNVSTATIDSGAVAMDENGVVIHANSAAGDIAGPMIAFGRNPWGYADKTALRGLEVRNPIYGLYGSGTPNFRRTDLGTVTYKVGETHLATLTADITDTQLGIPVSTLTGFDLTFPMVITLYGIGGDGEQVLICSNTANTLNACFDGRGYDSSNRRQLARPSGTRVYQRVANGTGTSFLSLYCADGVGLDGSVTTTAGTVSVTRGSFTITGNSTGWPINNGLGGHTIRITGTHSSGTPFNYYANIVANTAGELTVDKAYPSGADAPPGTMSYSINLRGRKSFVPMFTRSVGGEGYAEFQVTHCSSNTKIFFSGGYEVYTGTHSDKTFGYIDTTSRWHANNCTGTINCYGEDLANYFLWLRSGLASARNAARYIADNWLKIPDINEWAFGGFLTPEGRNSAMLGAFTRTIIDTDGVTRLDEWPALRRAGQYAVSIPTKYASDCTGGGDPRNIYYPVMWLGLLAKHDPDTVSTAAPGGLPWKTYWQNQLTVMYTYLDGCKGTGGFEFPFTTGGAAIVQMQANNTAVTAASGATLTPAMCGTPTGSGTATAVNGSGSLTILTGTVPANGSKILISGLRSGQYYAMATGYSGTGPVLLGGLWPGSNGTVNWRVENDNNTVISEAAVTTATTPMYMVGCTYNSPTSITLDVPYAGTTGNYWISRSNVVGYGQQPFFTGIFTLAGSLATKGATGATATNLQTMTTNAATWLKTKGYDPVTKGLNYANVTPMCDPILADANPSVVAVRNTGCNYTSSTFGKQVSRELLGEAQTAFIEVYQASPTVPNRDLGDEAYAALWGQLFCGASICGDGIGNEKSYDGPLGLGKWLGFLCGIGKCHGWPAVRLGGVAPADDRTIKIPVDPAAIAGAASVRITLTRPSSAKSICTRDTAGYCTLTGDGRQGDHLVTREYWSGAGATGQRLASSSVSEDVRLR